MKYYYWVFLGILFFLMCYTLANREAIIVEMMEQRTPVGPVPADPSLAVQPSPAVPDPGDLAKQVAELKRKVDNMEASSQAQINNAQAAVASVSPPGSTLISA
jgi:hypothetical protein